MIPMHLGLIDGPYVPQNLTSNQESPVPLLELQMTPKIQILMPSELKKEPSYTFSFCHKSQQINSIQVPQQGPNGERYLITGCFSKSLETRTKIPLNKNFFSSQRP